MDPETNVVCTQRASRAWLAVALVSWAVGIVVVTVLLAVRIGVAFACFFGALLLLFPILTLIRWVMFRLVVDSDRVQAIRTFVFRSQDALELPRIEGVGIRQGPFGRLFDYGRLSISGVGVRQLHTEPIASPHEVARTISDLTVQHRQ